MPVYMYRGRVLRIDGLVAWDERCCCSSSASASSASGASYGTVDGGDSVVSQCCLESPESLQMTIVGNLDCCEFEDDILESVPPEIPWARQWDALQVLACDPSGLHIGFSLRCLRNLETGEDEWSFIADLCGSTASPVTVNSCDPVDLEVGFLNSFCCEEGLGGPILISITE